MHELAVSQAIAELVLKEAEKREAKKVLTVEVEIGKLTFLNPDQVSFWVETSFKDTPAEGSKLDVKVIEPLVVCQACGYRGQLLPEEDPLYHWVLPLLKCPECGSTELKVEKGRECTLRRVELLCE